MCSCSINMKYSGQNTKEQFRKKRKKRSPPYTTEKIFKIYSLACLCKLTPHC